MNTKEKVYVVQFAKGTHVLEGAPFAELERQEAVRLFFVDVENEFTLHETGADTMQLFENNMVIAAVKLDGVVG